MTRTTTAKGIESERGAALIVALVMLLVMTVLGVTAARNTNLQERMAGNLRDNNLAFRFTRLNLKQSLNQAQIDKIYIESGERAINELRKEKGLEPYESDVFDWPIAM